MSPEQRAEYLRPYELTNILKEEMINLREETEGINIILKQTNKRILKDKFSALCYGLYYIKKEEDGKRHRRTYKLSGMMFMS
uniref:Terminase large subunit n=1 Tax=Siphoviridae sp. ct2D011 TaxID=2825314 RepID=A0A8S5V924_9CAUD|nr:MAG TPA: terminase large subunit [Siphoviridae sp. ct2D011]